MRLGAGPRVWGTEGFEGGLLMSASPLELAQPMPLPPLLPLGHRVEAAMGPWSGPSQPSLPPSSPARPSLPEAQVWPHQHGLGQRVSSHPLRVPQPLPAAPGPEPPANQEASCGAGARGEGGAEEGLPAGALPLPADHRTPLLPAQPQDQHRHQLVPQLQVGLLGMATGSGQGLNWCPLPIPGPGGSPDWLLGDGETVLHGCLDLQCRQAMM